MPVVYDNYSSDAELETRLATAAAATTSCFRPTATMPALLAEDRLRPLDRSRLPNLRHIDPQFLAPPFDPREPLQRALFLGHAGRRHSHRLDFGGGPRIWTCSSTQRYRGRITMLDDMENVVAAALGHLGLPHNSVEPRHLAAG